LTALSALHLLSLHDALPIWLDWSVAGFQRIAFQPPRELFDHRGRPAVESGHRRKLGHQYKLERQCRSQRNHGDRQLSQSIEKVGDRKSTRMNSSHQII